MELRLDNAKTLNLTLYGHSNYSSLDLHPPEEEDKDKRKDDEGQKAFYCCLPVLPTSESANQSRCLLWLANQTVSTATAKEKLPWKRTQKGWCQDERAVPLCSPCGQLGFSLRLERRGDNKGQGNWLLSFHLGESDSISFKPILSLSPQWSHFFQ